MISYSKEFYKKSFTAEDMKKAYMKAVKWYATNVLSKAEFKNVQVKFVKEDKGESPTITIHLFAVQDGEKDVMEQHCQCCREAHHNFYMNANPICNQCSAKGFQARLEQRILIKEGWYKELLRKLGGMN